MDNRKSVKKIKQKSPPGGSTSTPGVEAGVERSGFDSESEIPVNDSALTHEPVGEKQESASPQFQNPENIDPKSNQNMEVHHHPQLEHKPKPWKEYLLEGFMIFIAVMMGFIAENIRENITANEHTRQLTLQLVHDLKNDTASLNYIYIKESQIAKYNDTLFSLLQQPLEKIDTRKLQKLAAGSHNMWPFHPSAGAIAAIKNELHLKQFSNSKIISYFSAYESGIELLHTAQDINLQYQRIYLDPFITLHFTPAGMVDAFSARPVLTAQMRNLQQTDISQLAADMVLIRIVSNEMIRDNRQLKNEAAEMLHYVTDHYDLEAE